MSEHILFLTGKLAEQQLRQILSDMAPEFRYTVLEMGIKVAALMNAEMIGRRLKDIGDATRIIIPGRCPGDLAALSQRLGVPVERGPEEVKDLPRFFGGKMKDYDLSQYSTRIFAEIVDAPLRSVQGIVDRALYYRSQGADVIDIGCQPSVPFPHLVEAIQALKGLDFLVSVDSLDDQDLITGGKAGADYLLSLQSRSLWIADEVASTPILIPDEHGELASIYGSIEHLTRKNRAFIVDPILDPIHFGFSASLARYHVCRERYPEVEMMMGVGNLTELTHADTTGINTLLLGICSELRIGQILATEVSDHAHRAIAEADRARRILFAAKRQNSLPKHIAPDLMTTHETDPFPYEAEEIEAFAREVRDPNFRIHTSKDGVHIYNREGLHMAQDPFDLFPKLKVEEDGGHAFYLGVELARAEIAWALGKRYVQDRPLTWGVATDKVDHTTVDLHDFKPEGTTLKKKKRAP